VVLCSRSYHGGILPQGTTGIITEVIPTNNTEHYWANMNHRLDADICFCLNEIGKTIEKI